MHVLSVVLVGCAGPGGPPSPARLEVACDPTENALRFACRVDVEPPGPVELRYARADEEPRLVTGAGELPLVLLAPESTYEVVATVVGRPDGPSATTTVTTGRPPEGVDSRLEVDGLSTVGLVGAELPCDTDAVAVVYDTATGELVWYQELDPRGDLGMTRMLRFTDRRTVLAVTGTALVEVDASGADLVRLELGRELHEVYHHDVDVWKDRWYLLHQVVSDDVILDELVVLDRDGGEVARWAPREHLVVPADADGDWMHTNSVSVDPDGRVLLSLRNQGRLLEIEGDPDEPGFGEVRQDLTSADVDWSRVPEPASFENQHNLHRRRDGRWMLLDNDHQRALILSVGPEGAIADAAFPTPDDLCDHQGTAMETARGNPFVGCYAGAVREYDLETGARLWSAEPVCATIGGLFGTGVVRWYPLDAW